MLPLRPSDRHRAGAIDALRRGYLDGQLSTETFEARLALAHHARSTEVLRALVADLRRRWSALHALLDGPDAPVAPPAAVLEATLLLSRTERREVVVGRSSACTVRLASAAVSRHHARFDRIGSQWYVSDLASTNGTFVGGVRVERAPVGPDAVVRLADAYVLVG